MIIGFLIHTILIPSNPHRFHNSIDEDAKVPKGVVVPKAILDAWVSIHTVVKEELLEKALSPILVIPLGIIISLKVITRKSIVSNAHKTFRKSYRCDIFIFKSIG